MEQSNVYKKLSNGRYEPIGVYGDVDWMNDGIWYIRHYPGCKATSSAEYLCGAHKVGDAKHVDLPLICGLEDAVENIMKSEAMRDRLSKGYSIYDIVRTAVDEIYKMSLTKTENNIN